MELTNLQTHVGLVGRDSLVDQVRNYLTKRFMEQHKLNPIPSVIQSLKDLQVNRESSYSHALRTAEFNLDGKKKACGHLGASVRNPGHRKLF
ncbi:hypothetical protein STSP2_02504 [Anaerohalosphaera lusitana]|uniref:Uncharacterized protein n=1 Tax=Anaerohalosphaera lusitana TaxID=1936003 RepID=A0A1U9NNA3_9BACT|nr:hypothetical protein STSP2_02504 [Anaerohalosphaera lusitana]